MFSNTCSSHLDKSTFIMMGKSFHICNSCTPQTSMMDGMPLAALLPIPTSLSTSLFLFQAKQPHGKMYRCSILHIFFFLF